MSRGLVNFDQMTPRQIVAELDTYIVGQDKAKKAVAIALRNRVRRKKLPAELQDEVAPKNIIMIGPTGVGKTEIARRISKLSGAPFLKVEATKFTEVGYVGRDVESMIRDLMHVGINMVRTELEEEVKEQAEARVEELLLDLLLPDSAASRDQDKSAPQGLPPFVSGPNSSGGPNFLGINITQLQNSLMEQLQQAGMGTKPGTPGQAGTQGPQGDQNPQAPGTGKPGIDPAATDNSTQARDPAAASPNQAGGTAGGHTNSGDAPGAEKNEELLRKSREKMRKMLRELKLEDREVELLVSGSGPSIEIFSGAGMEDLDLNLGNLGSIFGGKKKKKRMSVKRAREVLHQEESQKLLDQDRVNEIARDRVQNMGIIFVDEIDKIASRGNKGGGPDVSREGVQRDILPIVEGCQVNTKYGLIDTSHILFIAAGAFHISKPSDLIPELQGRFPIRVELESLTEDDFYRILTQPANAITRQYIELLKTEGVEIEFEEEALRLLSRIAAEVNQSTENIGARRLSTIMERLLEEVSFHAPDMPGQKVVISPDYVKQRLDTVVQNQDLSRYIL